MSYYGIKNLKIITTEDSKYNVACSYYDSSITDWNKNRVWYKTNNLFKNNIETREELEYILFKEFLDGNFHVSGNCGKFNCLSWTNNKVILSKEETSKIQELEEAKRRLLYGQETKAVEKQLKELNIPYEDWKNHPLYKDLYIQQVTYTKSYETYRYTAYYNAWKQYLKQEKTDKKNKQYYIVKCNYLLNTNCYLKTKNKLCTCINLAKIYHKSINQIKTELNSLITNNNITRLSLLNITPYVQKQNKKLSVLINSVQETTLEEIIIKS